MNNLNGTNNIIGEGSTLKGNLSTTGNIRLEGKVIGDIKSSSKVACGETSTVDGNVIAENAEIAGKITGKVNVTELLVLKSSAVIQGDISRKHFTFKRSLKWNDYHSSLSSQNFIIESGAIFNGACKMGGVEEETILDNEPSEDNND